MAVWDIWGTKVLLFLKGKKSEQGFNEEAREMICVYLPVQINTYIIDFILYRNQSEPYTYCDILCMFRNHVYSDKNSVSPNVGSQNSSHVSSFSDGMSTMLGDQQLLVLLQDTARSLQKMI